MAAGILAGTAVPTAAAYLWAARARSRAASRKPTAAAPWPASWPASASAAASAAARHPNPACWRWIRPERDWLPAGDLWGKGAAGVFEELRAARSDDIGIVTIGQAGEQMLKAAAVVVSTSDFLPRTASRGGVGAVTGSKNLKAIVVDDQGPRA